LLLSFQSIWGLAPASGQWVAATSVPVLAPLQALPYELRALEAALLMVLKILQHEVQHLESVTHPGTPVLPARLPACLPACICCRCAASCAAGSAAGVPCICRLVSVKLPPCLFLPLLGAPAVLARIRRSVARPDLEHLYEIQNRLDKTISRAAKIKVSHRG
jgi:hypothetical protein